MPPSERFEAAIAAFDAANAEDPNRELVEGREVPKELAYARRMTHWLERLYPEASEPLRLAARSQHIRRWTHPRENYPMDRIGYLKWRSALKAYHAETAGGIMAEVGYDSASIERVGSLLRKERLKRDPEAQALEDVVCLVFLEHYFADFAVKHEPDKIIDILRKTWTKMSPRGREAALALPMPEEAGALVERALAPNETEEPTR
jgi:signal recognition particle subunit SEC65